jgi:uncharacterized SAM-binding protein YcdF (DUF218 family)
MFFILSKTIAFLLLPSNFLFAIALIGLALLLTHWRRAGVMLMAISLVLMALGGFLPVGRILNHTLESRFPPWDPSRGAPNGIIVLGGVISPVLSRIYGATQVGGNAERVTVIAKLARDYPKARIVYSGGDASLFGDAGREADYLYPLLDSFGVPRDRVLLETRARNTFENATFTKELVKPKPGERWLLVTSAQHMPRAIGCFRRIGFPVEAYPVDWNLPPHPRYLVGLEFSAGLRSLDAAAHESEGLLVYWLRGRTSSLLPGP